MDIYFKLFEVLFPVFFMVGIGYFIGKKNPKLDTSFITNFAANVGSPAMVFYAITTTGVTFSMFIEYFWYSLIAIFAFALVGVIFLVFLKKEIIRELPPFVLPNVGNMGLPMLKNLVKQGYEVKVYDINPKITKRLEKEKIKAVNNLRAIANNNFIISILPDTHDVESVFNDRTGINSYLKPGTTVIDMSTISS